MKTIKELVKEAFIEATTLYKNINVNDWYEEFKLRNPEVDKVSDVSAEEVLEKWFKKFKDEHPSENMMSWEEALASPEMDFYLKAMGEYASIVNDLPIELFDLAFESWANKQNWQLHSSNEYYYRSKNMHSWPPDETIEIADLKKQFMEYISIVNEKDNIGVNDAVEIIQRLVNSFQGFPFPANYVQEKALKKAKKYLRSQPQQKEVEEDVCPECGCKECCCM